MDMTTKLKLRCTGVPEHFNLPWLLAMDDGAFDEIGVDLEWTDAHGGTGEMAQALFNEEADLALLLTEGAVNSLLTGNPCKIHSSYVDSPLIWGVFSGGKTDLDPEILKSKSFLVSRFYSGSHLMGFLYADQHGRKVSNEDFIQVGNNEGALKAFAEDPDRLYLWEKYISMPYVDRKQLRLIDECSAPWPAFVAVVRNAVLEEHRALIDQVLEIVRSYACELQESGEEGAELIAYLYDMKLAHARDWQAQVRFSRRGELHSADLKTAADTMHRLGVLTSEAKESDLQKLLA